MDVSQVVGSAHVSWHVLVIILVSSVCAGGAAQLKATNGFNQSQSNVLRMLGYFSLVGLQRVHALVGDYNGAMKAIAPLNLFETKTLLTQNIVGAPLACPGSVAYEAACLLLYW